MAYVIENLTAENIYEAIQNAPQIEVNRLKLMLDEAPSSNFGSDAIGNGSYIVFLIATVEDVASGFLKEGYAITKAQASEFIDWFDGHYSNAYVEQMRNSTDEIFRQNEFQFRAADFAQEKAISKLETFSSTDLARYVDLNIESLNEAKAEEMEFISGLSPEKIDEALELVGSDEAREVVLWLRSICQ